MQVTLLAKVLKVKNGPFMYPFCQHCYRKVEIQIVSNRERLDVISNDYQ